MSINYKGKIIFLSFFNDAQELKKLYFLLGEVALGINLCI